MGKITQEDVNCKTYETNGAIKCSNCEETIVPKEELDHLRELNIRGNPNAINAEMGISASVESHLNECLNR
jgi:hypothetical protein